MKKGKAIEDNELKKASGGYIYEEDCPVVDWSCIYPYPKYHVVDDNGNFVGKATPYLFEAEQIAKNNKLSTEIINKDKLEALRGNSKRGSPSIFGNTRT